jgi:dATP pyrophosphohydrolase|tara:strand:- start:13481 stop:13945 length:465 start_codon:yes stop_codon:yes gene_type:complete
MANLVIRVIDAYVFYQSDNGLEYLLLKRAKTKMYEHLWQGVAGKIERKEEAWQAAIRELKEETGFDPARIFIADHISKFYEAHGDRINLVPVFGIEVNNKNVILSEEHSEYQWQGFEKALESLSWEGQKAGLTTVNKMLIEEDDRLKWSLIDLS